MAGIKPTKKNLSKLLAVEKVEHAAKKKAVKAVKKAKGSY